MAIDRSKDTLAARKAGMPKTTGSLQPMAGRCQHQLTYTGTGPANPARFCMAYKKKGRNGCRKHGAQSPNGIGASNYKHGLYSKALPTGIVENYERLLADPNLTSLKDEIAVIKAWLAEQMRLLQAGEATGARGLRAQRESVQAWRGVMASVSSGDRVKFRNALAKCDGTMAQLDRLASDTTQAREAMREFHRFALALDRLTRTENDHEEQNFNRISSQQAFALQAAELTIFLEALREHVTDLAVQNAIRRYVATKLAALTGRRAHPALDAGSGPGEAGADAAPADHGRGAAPVLPGHAGDHVPDAGGLREP